jgi:hypothetical protein
VTPDLVNGLRLSSCTVIKRIANLIMTLLFFQEGNVQLIADSWRSVLLQD